MIWALLAAYFLGGGAGGISGSALTTASVKQLSEEAELLIEEPDRSDVVQQALKELRKEVEAFDKVFGKSGRQLAKSYKDHGAERDEVQAILADLNSGWETAQQRALDLRFELRDSLTVEEWAVLFSGK
jgi:hypothetical protein